MIEFSNAEVKGGCLFALVTRLPEKACVVCSYFLQLPASFHIKVKNVKVQLYSLVSSAKRHSPDFTELSLGHWTCSFICHNASQLSGEHTARLPFSARGTTQTHKPSLSYKNLWKVLGPTKYLFTPGSRECTCELSALRRNTTSERIQPSRGSNPRSLACKSRTLPLSRDAPPGMQVQHFIGNASFFLALHIQKICIPNTVVDFGWNEYARWYLHGKLLG